MVHLTELHKSSIDLHGKSVLHALSWIGVLAGNAKCCCAGGCGALFGPTNSWGQAAR